MNELIFIAHIALVIFFVLLALRLGKNYLFTLVILQAVLANLFVIKQIDLFSKTVTATDVFIVGAILSQNLLQEFFGKKEAIKAIKVTFFSLIIFLIMAKVHLWYTPSVYDSSNEAFKRILTYFPRILISSIVAFFTVQRVDVIVFSFLKKIFSEKKLPLRILLSNIFSQLLDTVIFSFLALFNIVESISSVIIFSFLIKVLTISISAPFMGFSKKIVRQTLKENNILDSQPNS